MNDKVGQGINFYNVLYYNQAPNKYDTYDTLFLNSAGPYPKTSVNELNTTRGVDIRKIVLVKPVIPTDATNGFMNEDDIGEAVTRAYTELHWFAGVGLWKYFS